MTATKKGVIGLVTGAAVLVLMKIYSISQGGSVFDFTELIGVAIAGALLGFGYTFGWYYVRSITAKALGVAMVGSIITIILSKRDTLLKCVFIYGVALTFGLAIAYIPGIVRGIKLIHKERNMI